MSGPRITSAHFDVVATTRRRWSDEQKRAIVEEVDSTGTAVSKVARRHGIHSSQLFRWRRAFGAQTAIEVPRAATFVPVIVQPCRHSQPSVQSPAPSASSKTGTIEIVISGGRTLRVGGDVDTSALVRIIDALEARR